MCMYCEAAEAVTYHVGLWQTLSLLKTWNSMCDVPLPAISPKLRITDYYYKYNRNLQGIRWFYCFIRRQPTSKLLLCVRIWRHSENCKMVCFDGRHEVLTSIILLASPHDITRSNDWINMFVSCQHRWLQRLCNIRHVFFSYNINWDFRFITDRISQGGNAIAFVVRPSVCFHCTFENDWRLTLNFCVLSRSRP